MQYIDMLSMEPTFFGTLCVGFEYKLSLFSLVYNKVIMWYLYNLCLFLIKI